MQPPPSLVTFGCLAPWPPADHLRDLRKAIVSNTDLDAIAVALKDLSNFWEVLVAADEPLRAVPARAAAEQLAAWVASGETVTFQGDVPPSTLAMPMTVIAHLCQYLGYLRRHQDAGLSHSAVLNNVAGKGGIQGFCGGLLSALAVSGASDEHEVGRHGALAVRLAFAVGAYVDLDALTSGEAECVAVRWKSPSTLETLQDILRKHDKVYISAVRDTQDANLIVPRPDIAAISEELSSHGMTVLATGLRGRYHSSANEGAIDKIIQACQAYGDNVTFGKQGLTRSNSDGQLVATKDAVKTALSCILAQRANWDSVLAPVMADLRALGQEAVVFSVGADSIPLSMAREVKLVKAAALFHAADTKQEHAYPDHAIAVIGMSCKLPGADSIDEFWELLTGGKAMVEHVPSERFAGSNSTRGPSAKGRFFGNFMRDIDAFDHKFFKKSSREAASMDPQQRLLLQAAYEAMESSGYFTDPTKPKDIGCYIGLCAVDYDANVASHAPNAFSTLGTLRAFLSGKISHFFGWTGPSLTFDTACSSSAVAIHTACQALITGECSQAVAGGVALFTTPYLYENLAAAHFLSPTGATKPFDANADGYCRGEGLGLVVLKKLSAAVADGDDILGVLAGSAVNQNLNCVPITVPHQISQGELYEKVAKMAGIAPQDVSFVEAHGTGTPVGDPIEMESIRRIFGGPQRRNPLFVSSVKGNIGHLEGASGVAGLIKALLQMENRTACIQASFNTLNPKIPALEPDRIVIPKTNTTFASGLLSACVNNYGAAGSNSAMMLIEYPRKPSKLPAAQAKYPIRVLANSPASLAQYCTVLRDYVRQKASSQSKGNLLPSLAFSLARRQNESLPYAFETAASNLLELEGQLTQQTPLLSKVEQRPTTPPLVLVFGGQTRAYVGLSKELWQQSALLRHHLDRCDEAVRSLGHPSIYPAIFQTEPLQDVVALHSSIVSLQYSTAKAWMDSGLTVDAMIGHSIGQLAALGASETLSLRDMLKFVAGRAQLMQKHWGSEPGSMISVEADIDTISAIPHRLEVACYNGATSHVMVGEKVAVDDFEQELAQRGVKYKRLAVTNGFHSKFTEPLIPHLKELAAGLAFQDPAVPLETCSPGQKWSRATADLVAEHTRAPVFFAQAVERVSKSLGACTFLEAGSDSGVLGMVRRILDRSAPGSQNSFQPMALNKPTSADFVVDATLNLWKRGHNVQFWGFHRLQRHQYDIMRLPSYQFEKNRHWLEVVPPVAPVVQAAPAAVPQAAAPEPELPLTLVILAEKQAQKARFHINPRCDEYRQFVSGHVVAGSALCPATVYMEVAARAACELMPAADGSAQLISFQSLQIESPLGMATDRELSIELQSLGGSYAPNSHSWSFVVTSKPKTAGATVSHCLGVVRVDSEKEAGRDIEQEFARFERLTGPDRIEALYQDPESESIRGAMVYKVFSRVVDYAECYRGLRSVAAKSFHIGGLVSMPERPANDPLNQSLTQPPTIDSFMQVAGIHANSIFPCGEADVYVFTKLDRLQFGPGFTPESLKSAGKHQQWRVFSNLTSSAPGDKELSNDIFVFDAATNRLVVLILGARFTNVRLSSLTKVLSRVNEKTSGTPESGAAVTPKVFAPAPAPRQEASVSTVQKSIPAAPKPEIVVQEPSAPDHSTTIFNDICVIVERVAEVPRSEIKGNISLEDVGIDSLMMMEVISEISSHFSLELPIQDLETLTDVNSLVQYLNKRLGGQTGNVQPAVSSASDTGAISSSSSDLDTFSPPSSISPTPNTGASTPNPLDILPKLAALVQEHLELSETPTLDANLADMGLDSLLCIELASDIEKMFSVSIDMYQLNEKSTLADLLKLVSPASTPPVPQLGQMGMAGATSPQQVPHQVQSQPAPAKDVALINAQQIFDDIRLDFSNFSQEQGFTGFWKNVYPDQAKLVLSYVGDAFKKLGVDLTTLSPGQPVPVLQGVLPKHKQLVQQLHKILADGGYVEPHASSATGYQRTATPFDLAPPQTLLDSIIQRFPQHAAEHRLLNVTGSRLAECLTGKVDPLQILFANKANRQLLADVYDLAPMCQAATRHLATYLERVFRQSSLPSGANEPFHILEVGGGTGGTTRFLANHLAAAGIPFTYTFTDISSALVSSAKKAFSSSFSPAAAASMRYAVVDVEHPPAEEHIGKYHVLVSTNCVHASRDAARSLANLRGMLRPRDGILALVEFTRGLYWFDLVYGLLDGWWLFDDGRNHALANELFWERSMKAAGYGHVSWTDGVGEEARTLRLLCGFTQGPERDEFVPVKSEMGKRAGIEFETVGWKTVGGLELKADIYYPQEVEKGEKRPVALLLHGGGHIVFTRRDIHMKHIKMLHKRGFLPVSFDYRLCPETTLAEGPIADSVDALRWVRDTLPSLRRRGGHGIQIDDSKVAAVGWSSGGHLAMTLGYAAKAKGVRPPEVVVAFYCPTNLEADWWKHSIHPRCVQESPEADYDLLDGVQDEPLAGYQPGSSASAPGLAMTLNDPRWRLVIHMNWKAQLVPMLVKGLPSKRRADRSIDWKARPMPSLEEIQAVSPYSQIVMGNYHTPTFIAHGRQDDLIPWQQSQETVDALRARGVDAELAVPDAGHAFDLFPAEDPLRVGWSVVESAYEFLCRHMGMA